MKKILAVALSCPLIVMSASKTREYAEFTGVLSNPGQGWTTPSYASYDRQKDFLNIGAIYERYGWTQLEPEEGKFDWRVFDRALEFAAAHGIPAMTRIMCANSGSKVPETPDWVFRKLPRFYEWECINYSGRIATNRSPHFEDREFIDLHRKFVAAFAARYDGDPRFLGIDLGSYGNWGEWHCGKLPPAVPLQLEPEFRAEALAGKGGYALYAKVWKNRKWIKGDRLGLDDMKKYVDMYLDNFRKSFVVFMSDGSEVMDYALHGDGPVAGEPRVGMRRDGVGIPGHFKRWIGSKAYSHVRGMDTLWRSKPVWLETGGRCGDFVEQFGKEWIVKIVDWMLDNHVSLVNSFPFNAFSMKDEPWMAEQVMRINLYAGARLVPKSAAFERKGDGLTLDLKGENKGVAKIYIDYALAVVAKDAAGKKIAEIDCQADPRTWLPGAFRVRETVRLPPGLPDDTRFSLRLRHRAGVLNDFRFAAQGLDKDGSLPL